MDIQEFAAALARRMERQVPCAHLKNEGKFERKHVVEPAWELSEKHPEIRVFVHPEKRKKKCRGGCDAAAADHSSRAQGCPDCCKASKKWSMVKAFGTRSNFDLVAHDVRGKKLAVEVKWVSFSGGRVPNGEFQRFIGQCALAAARHDVVLGICGIRGRRDESFERGHERCCADTESDRCSNRRPIGSLSRAEHRDITPQVKQIILSGGL